MEVPRVEARVVSDSASGDGVRRLLTVEVRSPAGASTLAIRLPEGDVRLERVNGFEVPAADTADSGGSTRVRDVIHYGRPEGALTLELLVGPTATASSLEVVEHHLRPEALLGLSAGSCAPPGSRPT